MSGIESMEFRIIEKVSEQVQEIISEAEERARKIIEEAKGVRDKAVTSDVGPEIRMRRRRILGRADLEGRGIVLQAKEDAISRVFEAAKERMKRVVSGADKRFDYRKTLRGLLAEAARGIGENKLVVSANKRDTSYIRRNLSNIKEDLSKVLGYNVDIEIASDPIDCIGGVVVSDKAGSKIFHNTLEGRMGKLRGILRFKIAEIIFAGS